MSYIVLARKWRPMTFEAVVGQEHVTRTLMNALEQQRIAHAYIFAGPRGVGKTTVARLLAKAVNCEKQPAVDPCNQCQHCRAVTEGHSMDVLEIDGASNRGIDEIRNLRENIRFAPANARYKVYIIDEVHMLSREAFNALLKTLEEPPAHAIFIFATTEIHRVPLTILSRCQRFDFKRVPTALIAEHLGKIADAEGIQADPDSLLLIARMADGGMRDAVSILDQLNSFSKGKITPEMVRESLGIIDEELYFQYTELMREQNDSGILNFAREVFLHGHDVMNFLHGLQEHFRNLLITRATGSAKLLETSDYFKQKYEQIAKAFSEKDLLHYLDILTSNEELLKFSENPQLVLELLLLKLAHKPLAVELSELLKLIKAQASSGGGGTAAPASSTGSGAAPGGGGSISGGAKKNASGPATAGSSRFSFPSAPPPRVQESPAPAPPAPGNAVTASSVISVPPPPSEAGPTGKTAPVELARVQQQWEAILNAVKQEKIALASFMQDGVPHRIQGNTLEIAFDPKNSFHREHVQKNARIIEQILTNKFQLPLSIRCISVDFQKEGIQKPSQSPEEIFADMKEKEPVLKKIIDLFDCESLD